MSNSVQVIQTTDDNPLKENAPKETPPKSTVSSAQTQSNDNSSMFKENASKETPPVSTISSVQVIDTTEDHNYVLNEDALKKILLRDDVRNLPVVIVSVAGAYRGGKSFLLSYFLRYLLAPEDKRNENGDWLGDEHESLKGFSWKGGSDRHTTGILMYPEPFIVPLPESEEKVAVLLMDTQGTFDSTSTVRDCSIIFALSTLVSSVQIYNLKENLQEDDLQFLQLFTEYGRLLKNEDGTKPFQKLLFLIRDWPYFYENAFGIKGGEEFLRKKLEVTPKMPKELRDLREHIIACFDTVSCFLMAHPGFKVMNPKYDGNYADLSIEFRNCLKELVPSIFGPKNLNIKKINGMTITAADLFTYFQTYMTAFTSDKLVTPGSIYENTKRAALLAAVRDATDKYKEIMDAACYKNSLSMPTEGVHLKHTQAVNAAIDTFNKKGKMGTQKEIGAYRMELQSNLDKELHRYALMNDGKYQKLMNAAKEVFDNTIKEIHGENLLCLHPNDVEALFNEAVSKATVYFNSNRQKIPNVVDEEKIKFIQGFGKELKILEKNNVRNNRLILTEAKMTFSSTMEGLAGKEPPLDDDEYEKAYEENRKKAIENFEKQRNKPNDYPEDSFKQALTSHMSDQFVHLQAINRSKNRKQFQMALSLYSNHMSLFWDPELCCLHPADLADEHKRTMNLALATFHAKSQDDFDKEILRQLILSKYRDLCDLNADANEAAITSAVNIYIDRMENDTAFTPTWLLVVPYIINKAHRNDFHSSAREAALVEFYSKRRDRMNSAYDKYYEDLIKQINFARARY